MGPALALAAASLLVSAVNRASADDGTIDIGSRRELFVDDALVEKLSGKAELRLHHPLPQEVAIVHDAPWEGSGSGYHSIFKDGALYRMYYKACQLTVTADKIREHDHPLFCCYAESKDGIHWTKPELGLHEFQGSKANNIVFISEKVGITESEPGEPAVFKDENPDAPAGARYKALLNSRNPRISKGLLALPQREHREWRSQKERYPNGGSPTDRYGLAMTEALLMASRDGVKFKRWNEAFLRPGIERDGTWAYGDQYIGWQVVETKSAFEGAPNELSLYASENYWMDHSNQLRRYTLRLDGFVSAQAPMSGGELLTKLLRFKGGKLALNFATSAAGGVRVEIQDPNGKALPGFALEDCPPLFGDAIERTVTWKSGGDVSSIASQAVRLRFALQDADVYAFHFVK